MSQEAIANIRRGQEAFSRGYLTVLAEPTTPDAGWGATGTFPGIVYTAYWLTLAPADFEAG